MRTFKVYKHPMFGIQAVKVGFCWPAFLFGGLWMLISRLWSQSGIWFGLFFIVEMIWKITEMSKVSESLKLIALFLLSVAYVALYLIPGLKGNGWRERKLLSRGFEMTGSVEAETKDAAVALVAKGLPPC